MKRTLSLLAACLALCLGAGATHAAPDGEADRKAAKAQRQRINDAFETAKTRCATLADHARNVCQAEARASYDIARAELKASSKPGAKSEARLATVRARAKLAVANEKCDGMGGSAKEVCRKDAREVFQRDREAVKLALKERGGREEGKGKGRDDLADGRKARDDEGTKAQSREERRREKEARREARQEGGDRQDRLASARERCDALAGAARDDCLADAQRRFGGL